MTTEVLDFIYTYVLHKTNYDRETIEFDTELVLLLIKDKFKEHKHQMMNENTSNNYENLFQHVVRINRFMIEKGITNINVVPEN